ncbi:hypothetical protein DTO164E3_3278 [Paecilomyces variotii]|nr:hypothetical protein DTO032I3_6928 [Paecilomyces variotii]KAJ9201840.1 hypothetical protein DTO164E3_3278 [Paecilomyces variotii]KAJ9221965.1 hypothetical protein DTO169C6_5759 [Paecilomyces variotii]KAJ9244119.1 hypothetical protein DTO169E5_2107 [Paecilomyces variotii]KAJ9263518.1 hypothetical protein DTO195F2_2778 [Paecilomyces variotii]
MWEESSGPPMWVAGKHGGVVFTVHYGCMLLPPSSIISNALYYPSALLSFELIKIVSIMHTSRWITSPTEA